MNCHTWRTVGLAFGLVCIPTGAASVAFRAPAPALAGRAESITMTASYQDPRLLLRARELPVAQRFERRFESQQNPSSGGPGSLANIERSFGVPSSEPAILRGTGKCWLGICLGGLTLDELSEMARARTTHHVRVLRDLSYSQFYEQLRGANDPGRRLVVNFHRSPLFGEGDGHFSPIGGFLQDRDLVLVLDVNGSYGAFLVEARRLFEAVDTIDSSSGNKRGFLPLEDSTMTDHHQQPQLTQFPQQESP
jgi:Phytochelatin synthase